MSQAQLKNGMIVTIDKARPKDAAEILQFLGISSGDSDYLVSTPQDFDMTVEQEAQWLRGQAEAGDSVTLCGKIEGRVAALGSLATPRRARLCHTSELSLVVAKACRGKGVGIAMMQALIDYARDTGSLRLLHLGVHQDNTPAIALYEKMGFTHAGRLSGFFHIDGVYADELLMELKL